MDQTTPTPPPSASGPQASPTAPTDSQVRIRPGLRIGDYEILSEIGRGAMGVVYEARESRLERIVALKVLHPEVSNLPQQRQRMEMEARTLAQLDHPWIVRIHQVGDHGGQPFLSLQRVEGQDLDRRMADLGLPAAVLAAERDGKRITSASMECQRRIARFLSEVAQAVHAAHQCGVLHRDLKPANILVDTQGHPRITDFGLAQQRGDRPEHLARGYIEGTPSYIAPELLSGRSLATVLSDLYSIGAIGYELVTGEAPFEAGNAIETLRRVRDGRTTRPRDLEPSVDLDLEAILLRCLARSPADRYATAEHLSRDLERFIEGKPVRARPVSVVVHGWRYCQRRTATSLLGAAVLLLGTLGSISTWNLRQAKKQWQSQEIRTSVAESKARRLSMEMGSRGKLPTSGAIPGDTLQDLQTERIAQSAEWKVTLTEKTRPRTPHESHFTLSPAFTTSYEVDTSGGIVATAEPSRRTRWRWSPDVGEVVEELTAPDNQHLLVGTGSRLILLDGTAKSPAVRWQKPDQRLVAIGPARGWILTSDGEGIVRRLDPRTGKSLGDLSLKGLTPLGTAPCPTPGSTVVAIVAGEVLRLFDVTRNRTLGSWTLPGAFDRIQWSQDWIAIGNRRGQVLVHHTPSGTQGLITAHHASIEHLLFLPGTEYLFITTTDGQTSFWDAATRTRLSLSRSFLPVQMGEDGRRFLYRTPESWGLGFLEPSVTRIGISVVDGGTSEIRSLDFSDDSRWLVVGKQQGVHLVDLTRPNEPLFQPLTGAVSGVHLSGSQELLILARDSITWFPLDPNSGGIAPGPARRLELGSRSWLVSGVRSPSGSEILVHDAIGPARTLNLLSRTWVDAAEQGRSPAGDNALGLPDRSKTTHHISPAGDRAIVADIHGIRLVTWPTEDEIYSERVQGWLGDVRPPSAWTHDSRHGVWCSNRDSFTIMRSVDGRVVARLTTPEPATFTCLQFSPDGRWLAVGNKRGKVELWDLERIRNGLIDAGAAVDWTIPEATYRIVPKLRLDLETSPPSRISLGGPLVQFPGRAPEVENGVLDLDRFFNAPLDTGFLSKSETDPNLYGLRPGPVRFDGISFDLRGLVRLRGEHPGLDQPEFPTEVTVTLDPRRLDRVHLLAAAHAVPTGVRDSLEIARLHLWFTDGTEWSHPIRMGEELDTVRSPVRTPRSPRRASVAWTGFDSGSEIQDQRLQLYHAIFTNTLASKPVASLSIRSSQAITSPFVAGLTVE